jgi:hypothetical protein
MDRAEFLISGSRNFEVGTSFMEICDPCNIRSNRVCLKNCMLRNYALTCHCYSSVRTLKMEAKVFCFPAYCEPSARLQSVRSRKMYFFLFGAITSPSASHPEQAQVPVTQ